MKRIPMSLMGPLLLAGLLHAGSDAMPHDRVLARWNGGELTQSRFVGTLDPDGEALRRGGDYLEKQVCKAVFQAIYGELARENGLAASEVFVKALDDWREEKLAARYQRQHLPPKSRLVSETDVLRSYDENRDRLYTSSGAADIAVLFVRCGEESSVRAGCRDKMEAYRRRALTDDSTLGVLIAEERELSGQANGTFRDVPLTSLADELVEAILHTPAGFSTPVIETPAGLFWLRVLNRTDPAQVPFEKVEEHVRQIVQRDAVKGWRAAAAAGLRDQLDLPETASETECLAAAAIVEGLDREATFLAEERVFKAWRLADLAFFEDSEILPTDTEIAAQIRRPEMNSKYRLFDVDLLVVRVGTDRYEALESAEAVSRALTKGELPEAIAASETGIEGVGLNRLSAVGADELHRISRLLAEGVIDSEDGSWFGPLSYPRRLVIPAAVGGGDEDLVLPPCMVFAVRSVSRLPTVDEVRSRSYRAFRDEITIIDRFTEVFGTRWGLELLLGEDPEATPSSDVPADGGQSR